VRKINILVIIKLIGIKVDLFCAISGELDVNILKVSFILPILKIAKKAEINLEVFILSNYKNVIV
jgi:membrane protein YqaA with SNARE-associated domain